MTRDELTHECPRCHGTGRVTDKRLAITIEQRTEIRKRLAQGARGFELAVEYRVTPSTISRIKNDYGPRR